MKKISPVLILILAICLLSGCAIPTYHSTDITINKNGSGTVTSISGIIEEMYYENPDDINNEYSEGEWLEIDGETYYCVIENKTFDSIDELSDAADEFFEVEEDGKGGFMLSFFLDDLTGDFEEFEEEDIDDFYNYCDVFTIEYKFTFPYNVKQTEGDKGAAIISGKTVTVNITECLRGVLDGDIDADDLEKLSFTAKNPFHVLPVLLSAVAVFAAVVCAVIVIKKKRAALSSGEETESENHEIEYPEFEKEEASDNNINDKQSIQQ
ncbi:MAG: hypothetical protein MJ067_04100 [Oscillospiraceae bacterium]|nr:hypothetical protein [Oscillospiraceae bacterium]